MLLIETAASKQTVRVVAPRNIFCMIENVYQSASVADDATEGIFTNAGAKVDLSGEINWLHNPVPTDEEWLIEWSKFYFGLDMAHEFSVKHDIKYLRKWEDLVQSYIKQVPIGFDTSDVTARRVQNWIYAWQIFSKSDSFRGLSSGLDSIFLESISDQIAYIKDNLTIERNHRTMELYAIFIAVIAFPELDEDENLLEFALENLRDNLLTDIRLDGVQREQSSDYHLIVLRSFLGVKKNAEIFGFDLGSGFDERLLKACEFALHIHRPDGEIPSLSDGDTGSYLELIKLTGEVFARSDFLYVATKGEQGTPPNERNVSFLTSGYFFQRSGWGESKTKFIDENFLVFDCGHIGDGGHGHYDLLSVEIAANGNPLIVDSGRYSYSEDGIENWRHYFKGTSAHNTVAIDDKDQTEYRRGKPKRNIASGEFIERIELPNLDILCGRAESPLYDAIHTRRIFFVENHYWFIWDELRSKTNHKYDLRFHLTPKDWNHCLLLKTKTNNVVRTPRVALVFEENKNPLIEPSWYSPKYGVKHRNPCVSVVDLSSKSTDFFTLVYPIQSFEKAPAYEIFSEGSKMKVEVSGETENANFMDILSWETLGDTLVGVSNTRDEVKR